MDRNEVGEKSLICMSGSVTVRDRVYLWPLTP